MNTRTGSGAPGFKWQQQADYNINVEINDDTRMLAGSKTIILQQLRRCVEILVAGNWENILSEGNMTDKTKTNSVQDSAFSP